MISAGLGVYRSLPQNFIIEVTLLRLIAYLHQENNAGKRMPVYARQDRADRQHKSWGRTRFAYQARLHPFLPQGGQLHGTV